MGQHFILKDFDVVPSWLSDSRVFGIQGFKAFGVQVFLDLGF